MFFCVFTDATSWDIERIESPSVFADAISLVTISFAESMFPTGDFVARSFASDVRRCPDESCFTFAVITSSCVSTDRCRSTRIVQTLVHVFALGCHRLETIFTETLSLDALGIVNAIEISFAEGRHVGLQSKSNFRPWVIVYFSWNFSFYTLWLKAKEVYLFLSQVEYSDCFPLFMIK